MKVESGQEAAHIGTMIIQHGYIYPIDPCVRRMKRDKSQYFKFQDPMMWPSIRDQPSKKDYYVYLCKKNFQTKVNLT